MHAWWLPSVHSWWNFNLSSNRFLTYFSFPCWIVKQKPLWFHLSLISVGILTPVGHKKYTSVRGMCLFWRMKPIFGNPLEFGRLVFFIFFCWWNYNHWILNSLSPWSWQIKVWWCLLGWLVAAFRLERWWNLVSGNLSSATVHVNLKWNQGYAFECVVITLKVIKLI